jgi:hypothetical protein
MANKTKSKPNFFMRTGRTVVIGIRVSPEEADKLRRDAKAAGQTLSGRVASILRKAGAL